MLPTSSFLAPEMQEDRGMLPGSPIDVATEHTLSFLEEVLPRPSARILEVGCGRGEVLERLKATGRNATGIDSDPDAVADARGRGVAVIERDLLSFAGDPFDVVVFTRSLHHIHPLAEAVERSQTLVREGGLFVAEEYSVDVIDERTAAWFYDIDLLLTDAGLMDADPHDAVEEIDPLSRWQIEHQYDPPIHTEEAMLGALDRSFRIEGISRVPYLYRSFCSRLEHSERGTQLAVSLFDREALGVARGWLVPIGLRIVARRAG